jgi:hypothetical protein
MDESTPPPPPTLESIAAQHMQAGTEFTFAGLSPVRIQPWHVAAIRAKNRMPANRELDEERFRQLLEDVLRITVGGPPPEKNS